MRDANAELTVNRRVAFYRKKRGLTQKALAELVGKGESWMRGVEAERLDLDRLSVIRDLANALGVTVGDLIGNPILLEWKSQTERASVPKIRAALTASFLPLPVNPSTIDLDQTRAQLEHAWTDWQANEYHKLTNELPNLVTSTVAAARNLEGDAERRAQRQAASVHQLCAVYLPKLGETDLAMLAASRGLELAQLSGSATSLGSLYRIVAYALGSLGEYEQAMSVVDQAVAELGSSLTGIDATGDHLSVYGMLFLIGSRAAAQAGNREQANTYLAQADRVARHLGGDRNHLWTSFGPTNVAIHRTVVAAEAENYAQAVEIGMSLDTSMVPAERRGRHAIETARSLSAIGRMDDAVGVLLEAEQTGPEQIRHHRLSREVVRRALRARTPSAGAASLASRMNIAEL
ncbi:helix-turn-helix domain-containing protein [Nocardia amamiensis]|uniref:helix-turn-helix domain-containing protein n=1 Tax=Nocardia amamiensis TaxID=404578 RepID=UPI0008350DF9|nr:helix-turn-helix transcriptional regulator [Nocardia amamiensis]